MQKYETRLNPPPFDYNDPNIEYHIAFHKLKQFNEKSARHIWGNSGAFIVYTCDPKKPKLKEIKNTTICIHDSHINVSGLVLFNNVKAYLFAYLKDRRDVP